MYHDNDSRNVTSIRTSPPPARQRSWGQPEGDEPIIDAARIPLSAFGTGRSPQRALAMFLWLRLLRPAFTLAIWFCAIWYAWPYVLGARSQPEVRQLLGLYAIVIVVILLSMLVMGPLRRLQHQREAPSKHEHSSLSALASYIAVPPARLSAWQRTRQLLAHHDRNGQLRDAIDSAPAPLQDEGLVQERKLYSRR
ncbi:poly-beta-1,6-N-acetyl-D-glucosamine biosynthesis protein PgaD [Ottowia thiooxydans]|uniref:poly-beta-1,6-N-acetyl-D-glucosamine biosynthesis protein PgaD n=1 Tax=Ottowia thiooxydans TaxID=219182 RepID=UPI000427BA73|nr:poly-beta-1,6-N-acetyl-D-glucosamine biosynthesis protein PgaD [Ottowia thiooxydans]